MTIQSMVSLDGGQININFHIPYGMSVSQETALQTFIDRTVNSQFIGQKATATTADEIRRLVDRYAPLIYMLVQLEVHRGD